MRVICNNRKCIHRLGGGDENNCQKKIIILDSQGNCLEKVTYKKSKHIKNFEEAVKNYPEYFIKKGDPDKK